MTWRRHSTRYLAPVKPLAGDLHRHAGGRGRRGGRPHARGTETYTRPGATIADGTQCEVTPPLEVGPRRVPRAPERTHVLRIARSSEPEESEPDRVSMGGPVSGVRWGGGEGR